MGGLDLGLDEAMAALLAAPSSPLTEAFRDEVVGFGQRVFALLGSLIDGEPPEVVDAVDAVVLGLRRQLLSSARPAATAVDTGSVAEAPEPSPVVGLRELAERLTVGGRLGDGVPPDTPGLLWEWVHLQTLRLPEDQAALARKSAAEIGGQVGDGFPVPACAEFGYRGWDDSVVRDEVQAVLGGDDALAAHVDILATVLGILDRFAPVQTAHEGYSTKPPNMIGTSEDVKRYRTLVLKLIAAAPSSSLERALSCDEAIRSVYPWPLPALDSWWVAQLRDSERCVQALADTAVLTVVDPAAGVRDLKSVNAEDRVAVRGPDDQSQTVLWPLRIGCRAEPGVTSRALVVEPGWPRGESTQ